MTIFTKIDAAKSTCIRIMACQAETAPDATWKTGRESDLKGLTHLYTQAGVRYWGHM